MKLQQQQQKMYMPASASYNGISMAPPPGSSSFPKGGRYSGTFQHQGGKRGRLKVPAYAFILPNLEHYQEDFRCFLERDIIEIGTLKRLENSGHLNWWCPHDNNQKLWPLITSGDGNCLLHAASLGIWGVHDRQLNLRNTLHDVLKFGSRKHAIYRRWRWQESKSNLQSGLVLTEEEWRREWNAVLELASPTPRPPNEENGSSGTGEEDGCSSQTTQQPRQEQIYESLECVHVFALAHILKRPIIVVADTVLKNANGEELSPIPFGGIYLPLECPPEHCHRSPLLLCYDQSHFSALVAMRQTISTSLQAIPITDKNRNLLPVHFAVDPGPDFTWWRDNEDFRIAAEIEAIQSPDRCLELIGRYMDIVRMDLRRGSVRKTVPMPMGSVGSGAMMPSVPDKLLTLAAGGTAHSMNGNGPNGGVGSSSILKEIRQHFRWLGRKSRRKSSSAALNQAFSSAELLQSNAVLTVLLHNYAHQYIDSMLNLYIANARERFDRAKMMPSAFLPKNRLSRSFSTSSVLLTCLNQHCQRVASPSNNFLCIACFEAQKEELARSLIGSSSLSSMNIQQNGHCGGAGDEHGGRDEEEEGRAENGNGREEEEVEEAPNERHGNGLVQQQQPGRMETRPGGDGPQCNGRTSREEGNAVPPRPPKKAASASFQQQHRHQPSYDSALAPLGILTGDYCLDGLANGNSGGARMLGTSQQQKEAMGLNGRLVQL